VVAVFNRTMTSRTGISARTMLRLALGAAGGGGGLIGAMYWLIMSPYSQVLGPFPYRGASTERVVALTFDDGPNEPYTSQIADFLDQRGVTATFFQVGRAVARYPDVTARLAGGGHVIGHHGYAHQFSRYLRPGTLAADMQQGLDAFAALGLQPALYRPPWLLRIPALWRISRRHRLQLVSGEFCDPLEVLQPAAERIARHTLAKTRPGSILIFHDGFDGRGGDRASTVDAVKIVVDQLIDRGYRFTTVDRLLGVPAYNTDRRQPASPPRP
jgi:peptidoglycan/xylan/chitin deacetylase (PgdA/CDA1 family)